MSSSPLALGVGEPVCAVDRRRARRQGSLQDCKAVRAVARRRRVALAAAGGVKGKWRPLAGLPQSDLGRTQPLPGWAQRGWGEGKRARPLCTSSAVFIPVPFHTGGGGGSQGGRGALCQAPPKRPGGSGRLGTLQLRLPERAARFGRARYGGLQGLESRTHAPICHARTCSLPPLLQLVLYACKRPGAGAVQRRRSDKRGRRMCLLGQATGRFLRLRRPLRDDTDESARKNRPLQARRPTPSLLRAALYNCRHIAGAGASVVGLAMDIELCSCSATGRHTLS